MKHVVWPTRARTIAYTIIIIIVSLALGYFMFGVDTALRTALKSII